MAVRDGERRAATRRRILDSAWQLSRERGLTGWSLRDLGSLVGMRAPSLYGHFAGKHEIYDALFAEGYDAFLAALADIRAGEEPATTKVARGARRFVELAVADPARMQLLFLRVIPGFEPSGSSYARATRLLEEMSDVLAEVGVTDPAGLDLWTATLTGLATQQASNDPGGTRWLLLVDRAVAMLLAATAPPAA
ncbi:MAG: TetR/AcrR family transcriptional regulator [Marmoricola sp.]